MSFTVGSLFDGSGGFPLAAFMCGGVPVWASEIEPYPIAVTKSRFPYVKHLGSVTDIKGNEAEPVDVITFGSPCQDLSVAGKRAGLKHTENGDDETTRSGLFMEAVRIIKEMREATGGKYPRFALWENVPGAFSSNKGEDFRVVCEELIKIVEPSAVMPSVPKAGWAYADSYCGDGWSLAYRVSDAQYWGVPQRRRRIYLVVDFGGECAGEILFKCDGLRGHFAEGRTPWQGTSADAERGSGTADSEGISLAHGFPLGFRPENTRVYDEVATTICNGTRPGFCNGIIAVATQQGGAEISENGICPTITAAAGMSGNNQPYIVLDDQGGSQISVRNDGKCPTLRAEAHGNLPCVMEAAGFKAGQSKAGGIGWQYECAATLAAQASGTEPTVCYSVYESHPMDSRVKECGEVSPTVTQKYAKGTADTPLVCVKEQYLFENHSQDTRYKGPLDVSPMLPAQLGTGGNNTPFVVEKNATVAIEGNGSRPSHQGDGYKETDVMYTLNTIDRHAVAYGIGNGQANQSVMEERTGALNCMHDQQAICYGVDCRNATEYPEITGAVQASASHNINSNAVVRTNYIVRRLTPTECARLQGFPDNWGHPDTLTELTDEEYEFWLNVRNAHAEINGKAVKDYTKQQMLTWYNKLHTDSSEYKMWGNGIALPNALYVMQGIAEVFK